MPPSVEPRPRAVWTLVALLVFQGLSGVGGGIGLVADPTGRAIGLDPAWLHGSPFPDYLVPGLVLLVALGVAPLVAAWGVLRRTSWGWAAAVLTGVALGIWIVVEIAAIGYMAEPPLQLVYGLTAVAIVVVTLTPSVRSRLR